MMGGEHGFWLRGSLSRPVVGDGFGRAELVEKSQSVLTLALGH